MVVATLTTAGLEWIAAMFSGELSTHADIIAVGDGTPSASGLGSEHTANGFARGAGTASVTDGVLTVTKTFTASGADVPISESALYTTDATPVLIGYVHYGTYDLLNGGEVADGQSITIIISITVAIGTVTATLSDSNHDVTYTATVDISISDSTEMDPAQYTCPAGLCFNGRKITNGSISSKTELRGGRIWELIGHTETYQDILNLQDYATPLDISKTVEGYQYVNSILQPGAFKVYNKTTHTHDTYSYCWIDETVDVQTFGNGWWFSLRIVQDYRGIIT